MDIPQSAEDVAYSQIKQQILEGRLAPGLRLTLRTLASELGISITPVILALRMLERDGLVTNIQGMGTYVRKWERTEIIQLYEVRAFQEAVAARLCARDASGRDLEMIQKANASFKIAFDAGNAPANEQADVEFHMEVVGGAHCPDLQRILENQSIARCSMHLFALSLKVPTSVMNNLRLSTQLRDVHDPIVEAIMNRDPDAAEKAARKHVEDSLERNRVWIDEVSEIVTNNQPRYTWKFRKKAFSDLT